MFFKRLDYRYYLVTVISYALLLTLAIGCIFIHSDRAYRQLDFYRESSYRYIYEFAASTGKNDYMNCISVFFYTDSEATTPIHGDRLMALDSSEYDVDVPFATASELGAKEIAISYNLAKKHGLSVGSAVYSWHNATSGIEAYTVKEILPVCYGVTRVDFDMNYGVIIMGFDEDYQSSTDYSHLAFLRDMPSSSAGLIDLVAKETQRDLVLAQIIPWQSVISLLVAGLTAIYAIFHWKKQRSYYSRLYLCGGAPAFVKRQILADILIPGALGLTMAAGISLLIASLGNGYFSYRTALFALIDGFAALVIAAAVILFKGRKT